MQFLPTAKSIDESLRAHMVLIQSLSAQAKYDEFVDMSLEVLEQARGTYTTKAQHFHHKENLWPNKELATVQD